MPAVVRFADEGDAAAVRAIYAPFCEGTAVSFEVEAPSADEMAARIRRTSERFPWLVCEHGGRVVGYVYAGPHRDRAAYQWSVDVAAYVGPDARRGGVGRGLYTALFRLLVLQGYFKAYAGITLPNPGSVGLHQSLGFVPVGTYRGVGYKAGAWHDVGWWQLALQPERPDPAPPVRIGELAGRPEVVQALAAGRALVRLP